MTPINILTTFKRGALWLHREWLVRSNPVAFARSIGVNLGDDVKLFGSEAATWGCEPYLITIGRGCYIANGVRFLTHEGGALLLRSEDPEVDIVAPIVVGSDTSIGLRAVILPGIRIGENCIIGCNTVVTRDVPDNSVVFGVPGRVIMTTDEYKQKLRSKPRIRTGHLQGEEKARRIRELLAVGQTAKQTAS